VSDVSEIGNVAKNPGRAGEEGDERAATNNRLLWEAREQIAELRAQLAEQTERERVLELEVLSLRKDLEVKTAYCEVLERTADEKHSHLTWLQGRFDEERQHARALEAELGAERARVSYRVANRLIGILRPRHRP
jgi:hypothetical protein